MDPSSQGVGYMLREQGHRTDAENIQERGEKTGVKFHIAGGVIGGLNVRNWSFTKTKKLIPRSLRSLLGLVDGLQLRLKKNMLLG